MKLKGIFRWARQIWKGGIILLLFCGHLWALDPETPVDRYLLDQWEISGLLPSNEVLAAAQTPDGYLWIATPRGLIRFDGIKFSVVGFIRENALDTPENNIPQALFVDKEGTLWIGSPAGLTSYRYRTGRFKTFTAGRGITKDGIRRIKEDIRGSLWISFYSSYVNRFSSGKFTAFNASHGLEGQKINAIVEDRNGNLLFATREHGIFTYRDGKFFKYPVTGLENVRIIAMYEDRKGELWIGTTTGLFRATDKETRHYTAREGLPDDYITCITEDSDWNLWIGTTKGLSRIKKKPNGTIHGFESLLRDVTIFCLFEDREKSLWIGTYDSGIKRLKDIKFIPYEPLEAYGEEILLSLFEDRHGDTWIGTVSGKLFLCRAGEIVEILEIPGISGTGISAIADDSGGSLWLGTDGKGVLKKTAGTPPRFTTREGLADNLVTSISRDSRGNLWFCTFDGVSRYSNGALESIKTGDGLSGKRVYNVYEDSGGNIWIGADKGITVLKGGKREKQNMVYYLPDVPVTCIYEDLSVSDTGGRVFWIATHGAGLKRLRLKDGEITSYTTGDGMSGNFIYQFFEDEQENFWCMSGSGILRVGKKELNRFTGSGAGDKINCTPFGISDGMKSLEFNNEYSRHSALKTGKGEFLFITRKGIAIVNPGKIGINKILPPVVIEAVIFDGESVPLHQDAHMYTFRGITGIRFHFTAPSFLAPEKIRFKYRLEEFDREWVYLFPGKERAAHYRDLEPGTYTFRVIACNSDGVWNRTGDSFTFTLKPFFHETLVFRIGILVLFAALAAAVFYVYKKRPFEKKARYKESPLEPQYVEELIKKLRNLMDIQKVYCDADISLQSLAEKLSITTHVLSQVLNEKLNRNFWDFINSYRIEEARRILESPDGAQQKIAAVAFEVGFNTTVAFYSAFKKYTGMTPSQYRKKIESKT